MTTTVIVNAYCGSSKEVLIELIDAQRYHSYDTDDTLISTTTIQNGETHQCVVYNGLYVTVREVKK